MTREEFWALRIQHEERRQWEEYLSANIVRTLCELKRDQNTRKIPFMVEEFMVTAPQPDMSKRVGRRVIPGRSEGKGTKSDG